MYGFGKNERANTDKAELYYFRKLSSDLMSMDVLKLKN
ncbi:hypothetical protein [uncultured Desulfobacter sp.]